MTIALTMAVENQQIRIKILKDALKKAPSDPVAARHVAIDTIASIQGDTDRHLLALASYLLSTANWYASDVPGAMLAASRSRYLLESLDPTPEVNETLVTVYASLGAGYCETAMYTEALDVLHRALALMTPNTSSQERIKVTYNLGFTFRRLQLWEVARETFEKVTQLANTVDDDTYMLYAASARAGNYLDQYDLEKALNISVLNLASLRESNATLIHALRIFKKEAPLKPFAHSSALYTAGAIQLRLGEYQSASATLGRALEVLVEHPGGTGYVNTLTAFEKLLADAYARNAPIDFEACENFLRHAESQLRSNAHIPWQTLVAVAREQKQDEVAHRALCIAYDRQAQARRFEASVKLDHALEHAKLFEQSKHMAQLTKTLLHDATHDALTGLGNRRLFEQQLAATAKAAAESNRLLGVAVVDIDHFKTINDRFGHSLGDKVLVAFAQLLLSATRKSDVIVRYGGEEFICLLLTQDSEEVRAASERIRRTVAEHQWADIHPELVVTCSAGVALFRAGDTVEQTLQLADERLLVAKQSGRNRVEF